MIIPLGGGGSKVVASIVVTYPAGSTLTCTLGSKVLTAKDTSGKWVFGLPSIGDWVVNATKGSQSKSKTISITTEGQSESVTLSYPLHLFEAGVGLAAGYNLRHTGEGSSSANTTQITINKAPASENNQTYISPAIDCSQFSTVSFIAERTSLQDQYSVFDIGLAQTPSTDQGTPVFATYSRVVNKKTYTLDLSSINENLYFCIAACRAVGGYITDILFE